VTTSDGVARALVIAAHPDDVDFAAAGTVATWTDAGIAVTYCVVTDGDAGGFDPDLPRHRIAEVRRQEQTAAARVVGVHDLVFLGHPDGRVEATLALRRDLARVIRQTRPDRVLCPSPVRNLKRLGPSHPDHLAVGEAALAAVYPDARNPFAFPELAEQGHAPHTVAETWLMGHPEPDHWVDVGGVFDRKIEALLRHTSQHPDPAGLPDRIRGYLALNAAAAGLAEGSLAEAFFRIDTR
jgi:LmbE family N-acetylglucosaminyl deacetylase